MMDPNLLMAIIVGIVSFVVIRVGLYYFTNESNKKQETFERQFAIEQAERDQKVFQAKVQGNLSIDKLEEIYYPKQQKNGDVKHD